MLLLLRPDWPGTFRRRVAHEDGLSVVYTFEAGVPTEVPAGDLRGVANDLGKALVIPQAGTSKPDYKATAAAVADLDSFAATAADTPVDDFLEGLTVGAEESPAKTEEVDPEPELETVPAAEAPAEVEEAERLDVLPPRNRRRR